MEVLLVLAILLVLMGMVVPKLLTRQKTANIDATRVSMEGLSQAIRLYALDHDGNPPSTADGLRVLIEPTRKDPKWRGPYLEKTPMDAWGTPMQYRYPGTRNPNGFDLLSAGADRVMGTPDDLGNWEN